MIAPLATRWHAQSQRVCGIFGREYFVYFFKALNALNICLSHQHYAASRIYYPAVLRHKTS